MKYILFCIIFSLLITLSIKENILIANYLLVFLLLFLIAIEDVIILILRKRWCRKETSKLSYSLYNDHLTLMTGINRVTLPKFSFSYEVNGKCYEGSFSYDVRFFNAEKDTIAFAESVNKIDLYYNPNYPSRYFVIKPKNKVIVN